MKTLFIASTSHCDAKFEQILQKGLWHTITAGDPDENIDLVFQDAIQWVLNRI